MLTFADVLSTIGFWLFRGTFKRTLGVAIAITAMLLFDMKTTFINLGISPKSALGVTGAVLVVSCIGGGLLMLVSGSFSRAVLTLSEAKGSNLLEDMKKSRAKHHRDRLWDRVFRYEQVRYTEEKRNWENRIIEQHQPDLDFVSHPGLADRVSDGSRRQLITIINEIGRTREGFRLIFDYAMQLPLTRSVMKHTLRYDLSKVKDWYDGAPFHRSDKKLQEQFDAAERLDEAKKEARVTRFFLLTHSRKRAFQSLWFRVVTRAIQLRIARACVKLDKQFAPFHFSPDHFLWPTPDADAVIRDEVGQEAVDQLIELRQNVFHRVLNPEPELAHKLLQKTIFPNFEAATQLRRLYDPEYVLDELNETWSNDVIRYNRAFQPESRPDAKRRLFAQHTHREQQALDETLDAHGELRKSLCPEAKRALRIAVHIDHEGLKELLLGPSIRPWTRKVTDCLVGRSPIRPTKSIDDVINAVIADKRLYTRRLLAVRIHHELTRNELEDYEFYLDRILNGHESALHKGDLRGALAQSAHPSPVEAVV